MLTLCSFSFSTFPHLNILFDQFNMEKYAYDRTDRICVQNDLLDISLSSCKHMLQAHYQITLKCLIFLFIHMLMIIKIETNQKRKNDHMTVQAHGNILKVKLKEKKEPSLHMASNTLQWKSKSTNITHSLPATGSGTKVVFDQVEHNRLLTVPVSPVSCSYNHESVH